MRVPGYKVCLCLFLLGVVFIAGTSLAYDPLNEKPCFGDLETVLPEVSGWSSLQLMPLERGYGNGVNGVLGGKRVYARGKAVVTIYVYFNEAAFSLRDYVLQNPDSYLDGRWKVYKLNRGDAGLAVFARRDAMVAVRVWYQGAQWDTVSGLVRRVLLRAERLDL